MSIASTNQTQTPQQEAAERFAEDFPGLVSAAWAVGLENHRQMLFDHVKRVKDSHLMGAKALGIDLPETTNADDEMGNISISGDHIYNYTDPGVDSKITKTSDSTKIEPVPTVTQTPAQPTTATPTTSGVSKNALIAAVLGAGALGLGAGLLPGMINKPKPAVTNIDTDTDTSLQIKLIPNK